MWWGCRLRDRAFGTNARTDSARLELAFGRQLSECGVRGGALAVLLLKAAQDSLFKGYLLDGISE